MADQPDATPVLIRAVRPDDDLDAQFDLAERSFGPSSRVGREQRRRAVADPIAAGRTLGAFHGGRPVGAASFHDMRQWWCGRSVPMAGVASVKVAPEDRGRGVARQLMTALLDELAARGYPLSVLYPATTPLYRSLGWELAGVRDIAVIPTRSLRDLVPPDPTVLAADPDVAAGSDRLRRAAPADAEAVLSVVGRVHQAARDCGPITWDVASVAGRLADPDLYAYLRDDGFLVYRWHNGNDALFVEGAQAISASAQHAFWAHVGSHASIADQVFARVGPADVFWRLTGERDADVHHRSMWMLRVVDAPAAIATRGFPAAVSLTVPLAIRDDARPVNSGRWSLTVTDGRGLLEPLTSSAAHADPPLTLGARGLAALYAGAPVSTLRQGGLAVGGSPADDAALDTAFAGVAYMLDAF
ncbi:MAG TPA: GNAT family N-acetyltransferase [Streptosporangiaceae bacterium]|nr:GNAT family N-acetyltransferase [Streptosporangiaceae bacterium]